jgi:hypothetical protein
MPKCLRNRKQSISATLPESHPVFPPSQGYFTKDYSTFHKFCLSLKTISLVLDCPGFLRPVSAHIAIAMPDLPQIPSAPLEIRGASAMTRFSMP